MCPICRAGRIVKSYGLAISRRYLVQLPQETPPASIPIIRAEDLVRVKTVYMNRIAETSRFHES